MGYCRDDGLPILRCTNGQKTDKTRKNIIEILENFEFQINIVTNLKEAKFLDVTFNITSGTFHPYKKPSDKLFYPHTSSGLPNFPRATAIRVRSLENKNSMIPWNRGYPRPHYGLDRGENV